MLNKKVRVFIGIGVLSIILILMGYIFRADRFGMAQISWIDCVQMNNIKYNSSYKKSSVKFSLLDKKIGEVKFNVSENVNNPSYRFRNGDATFLDVAMEIYNIKSDNNALAVKVGEQYFYIKLI